MSDENNSGEGIGTAPAADVVEYMAQAEQGQPDTPTTAAPAADTTGTQPAGSQPLGDAPVQDGQVSTAPLSDEDKQKLEQEIQAALADERTPKWYRNAVVNHYDPKIADFENQLKAYEPLQSYGELPQVIERLEMLNGLGTLRTNPQTGMPETTTEPFVQKLYETQPETAYQLIDDLCKMPSPYTQGFNILQELFARAGVDPARLEDVQKFAANGYQLAQGNYPPPSPEDLQDIPQHLRATFSQISPAEREELMLLSDASRNRSLEDAKFRIDEEGRRTSWQQQQEQHKQQEKQQQEQAFRQNLDTKSYENFSKAGDAVFNSFVGTLAQQAGLSKMDSLMIANTVLNSFEDTLAGRQSLETLKAEGIEVDPQIAPTIKALEEVAGHIAYYEIRGEKANMERAVQRQVELQERLIAKGNKLIASIAQKRSQRPASNGTPNIAPGTSPKPAPNGQPSQIGAGSPSSFGFSEDDYEALIQSTGGYRRAAQ